MPEYSAIVRQLSAEEFSEILAASSRTARESYFHRYGIRKPKASTALPKAGAQREARTAKLFALLQADNDDEMVEELLRTWLLTKRAMLVAALDYLGIPHQDGLTDSEELAKFEKLDAAATRQLIAHLSAVAKRHEIAVYLKFMGAQHVDQALA